MAYEKQQWASGDIITAEKLNHMEDGIDEAGFNESNLPIAESLGSGDKLRIVTADGASKQIGADSVGVEVIKLATLNGGSSRVSEEGRASFYVGSFGGNISDTLENLTHGKRIIRVAGRDVGTEGLTVAELDVIINDLKAHINGSEASVTTDWEQAKGANMISCVTYSQRQITKIDIYAICI